MRLGHHEGFQLGLLIIRDQPDQAHDPTGDLRQAFDALAWGGRLVVVGYTAEDVALSGARLMFREMEVRGSLGCGLNDFPRVIDLVARGLVDVRELVSHRFPLEEVAEGFRLLESGDPGLLRAIVIP